MLRCVAPMLSLNLEAGATQVGAEGWRQWTEPSKPVLPYRSVLLAVPNGAQVTISCNSRAISRRKLAYPVRRHEVILDGHPVSAEDSTDADGNVGLCVGDGFAFWEELGIMRGIRLGRLVFFPARVNDGALETVGELLVTVSWESRGQESSSLWRQLEEDPLRSVVASQTVNASQLHLVSTDSATGHEVLAPLQDRQSGRPAEIGEANRNAAAEGADYLIITHSTFTATAQALAAQREAQGLSSAVVDVSWIYDQYGDGSMDPEAIKSFLSEAYHGWSPAPLYVLLVGDGSYEEGASSGGLAGSYVPPYMRSVEVGFASYLTAADNRYVCVDGDDSLPDMALGRLPVSSVHEAWAVVNKMAAYQTAVGDGIWPSRVVLATDRYDPRNLDFAEMSERRTAQLDEAHRAFRHYLEGPGDYPTEDALTAREGLLTDWNRGAFLIQYTGHASWQQWAALDQEEDGIERLFHLEDLPSLANGPRLPIVLEMTCFTSAFHRPEPTLDKSLVCLNGHGALATWGPTTLALTDEQELLGEGFYDAVFDQEVARLGLATLFGKLRLLDGDATMSALDTYVLLGDPALPLDYSIEERLELRYLPLTYR